jgi:hypothetical protein
MVLVAIAIAVVFGAGVIAGVMAMIAMAVREEEGRHTLTGAPPGHLAQAARRLTGVGVRDIAPPDDERGDPADRETQWWERHDD